MSYTFRTLSFETDAFFGAGQPRWACAVPGIVASYAPHKLERYNLLMEQLTELSNLDENWDGYGGAAIARTVIDLARSVLGAHMRSVASLQLPEIVPTSNGTLTFEWQDDSGEALVEIGANRITGFVKPPTGSAVFLGGEGDNYGECIPTLVDACMSQETDRVTSINQVEFNRAAND